MSKADGGPAFPSEPRYMRDGETQDFYEGHYGMSLRDYFAAAALPECIRIASTVYYGHPSELPWPPVACKAAYEVADAMLAEREK